MKTVTMILLTLFIGKGCSQDAKNDIKTAVVVYTANTRGFYQKIVIQDQKIAVSKDRNQEKMPAGVKISDADWKFLVGEFQKINLDGIADLKAPTEKRFYDGAAIGNLKITYKEKEYTSAAFDNGFPPVEIEKFVNKITALANKK
jgi:hypothetical protein